MRARAKRLPGQPGTKELLKTYGDRLVCVRYRYDAAQRKRYKTAEIIVDEGPWSPPGETYAPHTLVYVRVARNEVDIRGAVRSAGGLWQPHYMLWVLRYAEVERLGLLDRVVEPPEL
ncbi:MAG: hypothetical protein RLZZ387_327 [Chloroflexota bacterium]|jgi:hypothetical protein